MKRFVSFALALMLMVIPFTESLAASKSVKFSVTAIATLKTTKQSVGNEWSVIHEFNNKQVFKKSSTIDKAGKDTISLTEGSMLTIVTTVIEDDKDYPDVGKEETTRIISANDIKKGFTVTVTVKVMEEHGRYKGKSATWEIVYKFTPQ